MKSSLPKVFHPLGGRPVVHSVIETACSLSPAEVVLVLAPDFSPALTGKLAGVRIAIQTPALGTGHAVQMGLKAFSAFEGEKLPGDLLILFGDTPLITPETLAKVHQRKAEDPDAAVIVLGMCPPNTDDYGRLCKAEDGYLSEIIEFRDASPEVRQISLCNSGVMLLDGQKGVPLLKKLSQNNAAGEFYLTEIVALACSQGLKCCTVEGPWEEFLGINTREDLALAEKFLQQKWRRQALLAGATLLDPDTVYFSFDTKLAADVTIHPFVSFGPDVVVNSHAAILPFCRIEQTHIESHTTVGPFCHLRGGTRLEEGAQVGNFVETKNAHFLKEAKAKHLAYVGDAHVGERSNIGAGTITCNYDGHKKSMTWIGEDVFIGSNTALIAPVRVEDRAQVGAGSVITQDVPAESLAVGRAPQKNMLGRASKKKLT